jgi:hypothetical protein
VPFESVTYQAILEEGRVEGETRGALAEARKLLLMLGENRFGAPDASTVAALEAINDVRQLENLGLRLLSASSWQDLLRPAPRRRNGRRSRPS